MNEMKHKFENAIDNIENQPNESITRINREEIEIAHRELRGNEFWGYIDTKDRVVRDLVEKLLSNKL